MCPEDTYLSEEFGCTACPDFSTVNANQTGCDCDEGAVFDYDIEDCVCVEGYYYGEIVEVNRRLVCCIFSVSTICPTDF